MTYWKPQLCLCSQCTEEAEILYKSSFSKALYQRVFISEIQSPSNWPCADHQLVPTTFNESTEVLRLVHSPMTRRNKGETPLTIFQCYKQLSQCVRTKNMHVHIFVYTFKQLACFFCKSIISSATEVVHVYRSYHWRTFRKLHNTKYYLLFAQLHTFLTILIVALKYTCTHSLTSSSSESLHELLSSVIILTPMAESTSMSCGVSDAWNTGAFSSATDSRIERSWQIQLLKWNEMLCTSTHHKVQLLQ